MTETIEIRVNSKYAHLLFKENEGKSLGTSIKIIELSKNDHRFNQIPIVAQQVEDKYDSGFFFGWNIKRQYKKEEIDRSNLFHMKINTIFEPTGEECGTMYDETIACNLCGANRKQISALRLKQGTIPHRDISKTIGGEVVISEKFALLIKKRGLGGMSIEPVCFDKGNVTYFQLIASSELELAPLTMAGVNPWDFSESSNGTTYKASGYEIKLEKEIYKCPNGHTIGLNLLSEPYIYDNQLIFKKDFFSSRQKIGVKRGLLRPEPVYLCSPTLKKVVDDEKLSGIEFEITHIVYIIHYNL